MAFGYPGMPNYYQPGSYYQPQPMPDQLAQLRQAAMQPVQQPPQTGMIWVQGEKLSDGTGQHAPLVGQ